MYRRGLLLHVSRLRPAVPARTGRASYPLLLRRAEWYPRCGLPKWKKVFVCICFVLFVVSFGGCFSVLFADVLMFWSGFKSGFIVVFFSCLVWALKLLGSSRYPWYFVCFLGFLMWCSFSHQQIGQQAKKCFWWPERFEVLARRPARGFETTQMRLLQPDDELLDRHWVLGDANLRVWTFGALASASEKLRLFGHEICLIWLDPQIGAFEAWMVVRLRSLPNIAVTLAKCVHCNFTAHADPPNWSEIRNSWSSDVFCASSEWHCFPAYCQSFAPRAIRCHMTILR